MTHRIDVIPPTQAMEFWSVYGPLLAECIDIVDNGFSIDDLRDQIERGETLLVGIYEEVGLLLALVTVNKKTYGKRDLLNVSNLRGKGWRDWGDELLTWLDEEAEGERLDGIMVSGRAGWQRELRAHGYRHEYTTLIKELA